MYDPLVVDTFIEAFDDIAPSAIRAGQMAKSVTLLSENPSDLETIPVAVGGPVGSHVSALKATRLALTHSAFPSTAVTKTLASVNKLTPSDVCAYFDYVAEEDSLRCSRLIGHSSQLLLGISIHKGERVTGWAAATGQTAMNSDAVLDLGPLAARFEPPLRFATSCPVMVAGKAVGVLTAYTSAGAGFHMSDLEVLKHLSESLAITMDQERGLEVLT
jgi:GAF domain-containing protein